MSTPLPGNDLSGVAINASSTGDNAVVAAVATQCVLVFKIFFVASTATTVTFKDGASTSLTGAITLTAGGSFVLDLDSEPWFVATRGNAFIISQSGTAQLSGRVYYQQR